MNKDFQRTFKAISGEYGEDFEILNGFHESQLNFSDFVDAFVDKNVADVTIDANANASNKDIRSLMSEKGKSNDKLIAFNKIFHELKKKYGLKVAKEWLETEYNGGFYLHDASTSTYFAYCYAYDLTRLATEGLFFLKNYNSKPPKHLTTFIDDVIEYISYMSNRSSGAVGIPNILIWTYYFWKKDCELNYLIKDKDYYIKQCFQRLIYRLNQPFMRIDQSAFVNVSIFDRNYIESLFGGIEYPDGTFVIDYMDELIEHQKVFMEVVSDVRKENMFTFPVLTYSLLYQDGFIDKEFARWCSDHNTLWNDSNFFTSDNVSTLSNCPVSWDTKIFHYSERYGKYFISNIKDIYNNAKRDNKDYFKTISNGKEVKCKINKFNIPIEYEITLVNGAKLKTTANHLNKVYGKDYIQTKDLTINDYLPYSLKSIEISTNLTKEEGVLVGMFLGDGSYRNSDDIVYSLHKDTDKDLIDFLYEYTPKYFGAKVMEYNCISPISEDSKCCNVCIVSTYLRGLIEQFVVGDGALNKSINSLAFSQSIEFRKGIIEGLYKTDGGNSNRIYTYSEDMKDGLISLFATLGMITNITEDNREGRLSTNTCYVIRFYTPNLRSTLKDIYIKDEDYLWIKIKSIEYCKHNSANVSYCVELLEDTEPIFTLGNGIITHNCRLLSDTSKLDAFINSIGGTALSIGSVKVNTMNLMRIALEANDEKKYLTLLKKRTTLCCKTLNAIRYIIKRNIEKGLLPNYQNGAMELSKQYCTIGILGLYEVIEYFGYIQEDEFGYKTYTDKGVEFACKIFDTINDIKDNFTSEYSFNIESVPAERAAVILCQKDNVLFDLDKNEKFIYSNQWIPLSEKCTIAEKIRLSSILDKKCSGGAIAHINIENNFPNKDVAWDMLNYIAQNGVIYFAFNSKINECKNHHGFVGTNICPECGEGVSDTYQRIIGYLAPTRSYSKDRFKEFNTRKWYEYSEIAKDL